MSTYKTNSTSLICVGCVMTKRNMYTPTLKKIIKLCNDIMKKKTLCVLLRPIFTVLLISLVPLVLFKCLKQNIYTAINLKENWYLHILPLTIVSMIQWHRIMNYSNGTKKYILWSLIPNCSPLINCRCFVFSLF